MVRLVGSPGERFMIVKWLGDALARSKRKEEYRSQTKEKQ